jgi:adenylate kinase
MPTRTGRFCPDTDILVLDGIPRCLHQAEMLKGTLDVKAIFYLCCSDWENLVSRIQRRALKENRLDDAKAEVIQHRLKTYERETKPLLQFYGRKITRRVDATQAPVKVAHDILAYACQLRGS